MTWIVVILELGLGWLAVGIIYLAVLTRVFRRPAPELHTDEPAASPAATASST